MREYSEYKKSGNSIIGNIPSRWNLIKFKRICHGFNNGTSCDQIAPSENTVAVSRIETISGGKLNYDKVGYILPDSKLDRYKLNKGDILFSNINSYEKVGNTAIYDGRVPLYHGMNLLRIIPNTVLVNNIFLYHYLKSTLFTLQVQRKCKPAINQVSVPSHYVKDIDFPFPSLAEQESIASFLDEKTTKIDEYIDKKNKEIEALKEWKKALIAHVVTKGLNTNAKMKDSGVSWIGEIPEHWEVKRLGSAFIENRTINSSLEITEAYKFNYGALIRKDEDVNPTEMMDTYCKYTCLNVNDIVINGLNLNYDFVSQRVAKAYAKGIITSAYLTLTPRNGINSNYYLYLLKSMDSMKLFHGMGTGIRLTLSYNEIKKQQILFPPLVEQQEIVEYIDAATTKADKMIVELTNHVESMKEYKQRLIADVVTGKINVQP